MYRDNYINSLRAELVGMVADHLTPVALRYGYSEVPLEANIKWRPQVLVLGNYSSGKSTLINEFLGAHIQATGQAPTDDSFTIITYDDSASDDSTVRVTEERDGKFLLNDPEYPFEILKKHGQRFAAHFRLKKVNSPFLKNLAIIDTPGMLDSITERDRGYNYQEVIGDLAQIADLVLVVFDPHKAGTVRESYISIRETLPTRTFEDRILFVLNRIDECSSLIDLLRVYGTLCWNLSQITGRKDIPMIHLTYSPHATAGSTHESGRDTSYLHYLKNQREELKNAVLQAPRHRLDHLATFIETHAERLSHFLEALISYRREFRIFRIKHALIGLFVSILCGGAAAFAMTTTGAFVTDPLILFSAGGVVALGVLFFWMTFLLKHFASEFHRNRLSDLDSLTPLENQTRRDSWQAIRDLAYVYLKKTVGRFSLREVKREYAAVRRVRDKDSREIREALNELSTISHDEPTATDNLISIESPLGRKR
ncbi:MAG: dynamin family protein [Deltaproteobacteria bacterium]|nr:dynamin family protein [Deltaproteobacteria bacterium]MBW2021002.1 dynamin family protein [Deltaproteobacteria bacterium]MBW2075665.1 dynamin family protein [Deltaproteobacteria bacterium]RLB81310.1 MAG: Dynamin family protein [Deltaproteobacteria bacterium]